MVVDVFFGGAIGQSAFCLTGTTKKDNFGVFAVFDVLDEIGDLPLELQSKLLRVLQEGEINRLGNSHAINVDVRVIAATNRNLEEEREKRNFREDLYYRLNVFPIKAPPLRERKEDIPLLVNHFVKKYSAKTGKKIESIPQNVMKTLQSYHWPGNVRELDISLFFKRALLSSFLISH